VIKSIGYVDLAEIRKEWAPLNMSNDSAAKWTERFLTTWLIADHGLVNKFGHCFPAAPGYQWLPENPDQADRLYSQEDWAQFETIPRTTLDKTITYNPHSVPTSDAPSGAFGFRKSVVIMFSFLHTPHDGLLIVMTRKQRTWKIVRLFWVVT